MNSDLLKQTQWTDEEKRRPWMWRDEDKRRPIVDWPDLDLVATEHDFKASPVDDASMWAKARVQHRSDFSTPADPADGDYVHISSTYRPDGWNQYPNLEMRDLLCRSLLSASARKSSAESVQRNPSDFSLPINYTSGARNLLPQKQDERCNGISPRPSSEDATPSSHPKRPDLGGNGVRLPVFDSLDHPPRPSSRVPQYNQDLPSVPVVQESPFWQPGDQANQLCSRPFPSPVVDLRKSESAGKKSASSSLQPGLGSPKVKGVRSNSQPEVLYLGKESREPNCHLATILNSKSCQQEHRLPEIKDDKTFDQNQSKASEEYEKHVTRSQESYKAKRTTNFEPHLTDNVILSTTSNQNRFCEELPKTSPADVFPKQKSALELHLSSSFGKPVTAPGVAAGMPRPTDELQGPLRREPPLNIEVDIHPPKTADSPQVYGMSVRLSGSQERLARAEREASPQMSVAAIKAKLFGQIEDDSKKILIGRQMPIHISQPTSVPVASKKDDNSSTMKAFRSEPPMQRKEVSKPEERLYDYVSYKDGLTKKRSQIHDPLTDFERTFERLDFDEYAPCVINDDAPLNVKTEHNADPTHVKRLSITNLKLLAESQERLVPNPSREYTKEWLQSRNGDGNDGPQAGLKVSMPQSSSLFGDDKQEWRTSQHPDSVDCNGSFPRKVIDDMAYRKYGGSVLQCAQSEPDLPTTSAHQLRVSHETHVTSLVPDVSVSISRTPGEKTEAEKKCQKVLRSSYECSPTAPDPLAPEPQMASVDPNSRQVPKLGTRICLRQLNRSSSFEASSHKEVKRETQQTTPSSGVARLVELFELSQSAPDLTEAGLFHESYSETGDPVQENTKNARHAARPKRQKTPKDVKLRSESKARIRPIKVKADSGFVESETDSLSSSGPEFLPTAVSACQDVGGAVTRTLKYDDVQSQDGGQRYAGYRLLTGVDDECQMGRRKKEPVTKPETPDERTRRQQRLRREWFQKTDDSPENSSLTFALSRSGFTKKTVSDGPPAPESPDKHHSDSRDTSDVSRLPSTRSIKTERSIGLDSVRGTEIQKTTLNLNLSVPPPPASAKQEFLRQGLSSQSSFESKKLDDILTSCVGSTRTSEPGFPRKLISGNSVPDASAGQPPEHVRICVVNEGPSEKRSRAAGLSTEREDHFFEQKSEVDKTITESKTERVKFEPKRFEASKKFERTVDQPLKRSFEHVTQEFEHKEQTYADADVRITKQQTQTKAEHVYRTENKNQFSESSQSRAVPRSESGPRMISTTFSSEQKRTFFERSDFSDGEMTDATDVTLDAMVGVNQARPSSPETLDFSDLDVSLSSFSSKVSEQRQKGFYTKTEVIQKNSEGMKKSIESPAATTATVRRPEENYAASGQTPSKVEEAGRSREEQIAQAQAEMKLYRKEKEVRREDGDRKRSIKELVDSFEVMASPFMRTRQRTSEIRAEDIDGVLMSKGDRPEQQNVAKD